jgi:hypothetical protein
MNKVTLASLGFLVCAVGLSGWILTRSSARGPAGDATGSALLAGNTHAGLTFAEWSVRSDGVLLADIDVGEGVSTVPRRFVSLSVKSDGSGPVVVTDGPAFSWAPADRAASAQSLFALGFRVNTEGRAFVPPDDPLYSDPIVRVDGGTEQTITLRSRSGIVATFSRRRADPKSAPYWNRRAFGSASPDGHLVYVTPDAVVIPMGSR